ncbi:MAG: DHH family phosphoesterase [Methanosarcinaceae archaeon]|nr:DHH family phosphoesterase [Methanosarcinaceae archaeon]
MKKSDDMDNLENRIEASKKIKSKPSYLILGSGSIGFALVKKLKELNKEIFIIDKDEQKVETLREEGYDAIVGDLNDPTLLDQINTKELIAILILSSDNKANETVLKNLKDQSIDIYSISRASDIINKQKMDEIGANQVIVPSRIVATSLVTSLERVELLHKGTRLSNMLRGMEGKRLAIVIHNNPDPDAIGSAIALEEIANSFGIESTILYNGEISHQENKAFVNLMQINLNRIDEYNISDFDKIALLDCAIPGANNILESNTPIDIIIDHHPTNGHEIDAEYIDIRPIVGATCTIMTKYLQELNIDINKRLATALLHGIRTDTQDFKRNADSSDLSAASYLYPISDHNILKKLEHPPISTETLNILGDAINNRQVIGSYLLSNVGSIRDRDALPQAADYLLHLEGVSTSIVFGVIEDMIYISGRSKDIRVNLGAIMKKAFGDECGGGHATSAAAQIPLGVFSDVKDKQTLLHLINDVVVKKFFDATGVDLPNE